MGAELSKIRREVAERVAAGAVTYAPSRAKWYISDAPARGWIGRTLREMRADGSLVVEVPARPDSQTLVQVALSEAVQAALAESAAPTD